MSNFTGNYVRIIHIFSKNEHIGVKHILLNRFRMEECEGMNFGKNGS